MKLALPWFLPLALAVGLMGSRSAFGMRRELHRRVDAFLMLGLSWFPLVAWILIQWIPQE